MHTLKKRAETSLIIALTAISSNKVINNCQFHDRYAMANAM